MPNLPTIIAMILYSPSVVNPDRVVWLFSLPAGARAPNQVEEVAGSRDAVESQGIAELLHDILEDEEA
jgi:hypothetical protein